MRVLVCGGRSYTDYSKVNAVLNYQHYKYPITIIVYGMAPGADSLARRWAFENNIPVLGFPAEWSLYGKAAGLIRNRRMVEVGKPDLVIAFPGGPGTANMITVAKEFNISVVEIG